jgi:sulfur-oxidizing protein SoxZ
VAVRTLIDVPRQARRGDVIHIRATIAHPMETGFRSDSSGRTLPRDIIRRFSCRYNGETVFSADLYSAIAANPYIAFHTLAGDSGTLELRWEGDHGFVHTETVTLTVA